MKRALVISGGGSKGAFAVGVLQQLKTIYPKLRFDIIVGTSVGALITPLAAVEELALLKQLFTTITTDKVVTQHRIGDRLSEKSIYTVEPLYQLLKTNITDARYNAIQASGKSIFIVTTCLQTAGIVVYTNSKTVQPSANYSVKGIKDAEHLRLAVLASACQPVLMTPVKIDAAYSTGADKNFQYVDGGVQEYAGIQMALDAGATEVFCILLNTGADETLTTDYTTLFPILQRTIAMFSEDVQKNDVYGAEQTANALEYISGVKKKMKADNIPQAKIDSYFATGANAGFFNRDAVKIYTLRPGAPLGGGPGGLLFNPPEMTAMMNLGSSVANDFAAKLPAGNVTWA